MHVVEGILGAYDLYITTNEGTKTYWAVARDTPNGEAQIDWSDEISDLLSEYGASEFAASQISLAVFQEHIGESIELPMVIDLAS